MSQQTSNAPSSEGADQFGMARANGFTVQDVYAQEMGEVPRQLQPHWTYLGDQDVPRERYYSKEWHDLEVAHVWSRTWQMACRESDIPETGDQTVHTIANRSVLITRGADDDIYAFWNACLHRGTELRSINGCDSEIRCPFHGWRWTLDGKLKGLPGSWDLPHVSKEQLTLPQLQVARWQGFVFVNPDPEAEPFEAYAEKMVDHWSRWPLKDHSKTAHVSKQLRCNWKVAMDAFLEGYHVAHVHPELVGAASEANVQYDIWDGHASRLIYLQGIPSPDCPERLTEQEVFDMNLAFMGGDGTTEIPQGATARQVLAAMMRDHARQAFEYDLPVSDAESLDIIVYYLFPNIAIWAGTLSPIVYCFSPAGDNPEQCIMEVLRLQPTRPDETPTSCPVHHLGFDEPFADAPELGIFFVAVLNQDGAMVDRVQRGLRSTAKPGVTLTNYQESLIRNHERLLEHYIYGFSQRDDHDGNRRGVATVQPGWEQ